MESSKKCLAGRRLLVVCTMQGKCLDNSFSQEEEEEEEERVESTAASVASTDEGEVEVGRNYCAC